MNLVPGRVGGVEDTLPQAKDLRRCRVMPAGNSKTTRPYVVYHGLMIRPHHVYAIFSDHQKAVQAFDALLAAGYQGEHCSAFLHEHALDRSALTLGERALPEGAIKGGSIGATAGAIIGTALALGGGLVGVGPLAAIAAATGLLSAYGAGIGIIAGSSEADERLRNLQALIDAGHVLIAVEVDDPEIEKRARSILVDKGGVELGADGKLMAGPPWK